MISILDYTSTDGTAPHIIGGIMSGILCGPRISGLIFALCIIIYQVYDSLPLKGDCWNHTKWDILEMGVGVLFGGICISIFCLLH